MDRIWVLANFVSPPQNFTIGLASSYLDTYQWGNETACQQHRGVRKLEAN